MNLAWVTTPWALVVMLAAYRVTRLWIEDMVPPLPRLRYRIAMWADRRWDGQSAAPGTVRPPDVTPDDWDRRQELGRMYGPESPWSYLVTCYWCTGFWWGALVLAGAVFLPLAWWALPYLALALSATTGLLARLAD